MKLSGKLSGFVAVIAAAFLTTTTALPGLAHAQAPGIAKPNSGTDFGNTTGKAAPPGSAAAAPAAKPPTKEQIAKGMKDGPALIAATGVQCTPVDIVWKGKASDPKTKAEVNAYETTCKEGLGYIVVQTGAEPKPAAYDCMASGAAGPSQACILPGNADPKKGLGLRSTAGGRPCDVKDAAYIGSSSGTGEAFYEMACTTGPGFRLGLLGAKASFTDCLALVDTSQACKFTTKEQSFAVLAPAVKAAGKPCDLKEVRFVGSGADGADNYYEIACQAGPGFMLDVTKDLAFKSTTDCTRALGIGGGCKMTDVTVAQNAEAGTYTRLAAKAGFPCAVSKYRLIGVDKENREVVELACSDRPDGALAVFADPGKSDIYDCVMAGKLGQECKLSKSTVPFDKYSAALAAKGKGTCKVSDARFIGTSPQGDFVETACSDGLPGWVISLSPTGTVGELLNCKQASTSGAPCKLPTNVKGNG